MPNAQNVCKAPPKVLRCTCGGKPHEFQDRYYGRGMRLCNPTGKAAQKDGPSTYRCTVCGDLVNA